MNRGYAIGFLIVLLIALVGMYVAVTGFQSARQAYLAQASAQPTERPEQATRLPTRTPTPPGATATAIITASAEVTATMPPAAAATEDASAPAEPAETDLPADTATPEPTAPPLPTAPPQPAFQFRVFASRPDPERGGCCYIFGTVRDAGGNMLEGVRVAISNQWNAPVTAVTKGGPDLGNYDFPIGSDKITWYVSIVDAGGNRISTEAVVPFDPTVAGQYRVEWQRTY